MATLTTVVQLIQSLSRSEKRNFTSLTSRRDEEPDYMKLYLIIKAEPTLPETIIEQFKIICPKADLNATVHYLYQVLMRSLLATHAHQHLEEELLTGILEVRIILGKGMVEEGLTNIMRLRNLANSHEKYLFSLMLDKLELQLLNQYQYLSIKEDELIKLQARIRRYLQYESNLSEHAALYELLNYRYLHQGLVRNQNEKEKLNDLVVSEMNLTGNPRYQSFDLKKNHLLFQSVYFLMTGDNKSSLLTFMELNGLFETNRQLWNDAPGYYISHVRGILNGLCFSGQFEALDFFIERLKVLSSTNPSVVLAHTIFVATLRKFLGLKQYDKALSWCQSEMKAYAEAEHLPVSDKAEMALYVSIAYLQKRMFKEAAKYLKTFVYTEILPNKQQWRVIRLIHLIIHFELNDFEYLQSEVRSLERQIKQSRINSQTETIILRFMKKYPFALSRSARKHLYESTLKILKDIGDKPYEKPVFQIFDFSSWIESKLDHPKNY